MPDILPKIDFMKPMVTIQDLLRVIFGSIRH